MYCRLVVVRCPDSIYSEGALTAAIIVVGTTFQVY